MADTLQLTITGNSASAQAAIRAVRSDLVGMTSAAKGATAEAGAAGTQVAATAKMTATHLRAMGQVASEVGRGMQIAGGLIVGSLGLAVKAGDDYNRKLVEIRDNTTLTTKDFGVMKAGLADLGSSIGVPIRQMADGFMHITNLGFKAADAMKILKEASLAALSTGGDPSSISNLLAGTLHQFNLPGSRAKPVMNLLHMGAALGNETLPQFSATAGPGLATAGVLGDSLPDAIAAMSALTRQGFSPSRAVTQFVGMLTHIAHPGKAVSKELAALTKSTGIDLTGDFSTAGLGRKGTFGVLGDISKAAGAAHIPVGDLTTQLITALRGGIGAGALADKGRADFAETHAATMKAAGGGMDPIGQGAARMAGRLHAQMTLLKNDFTILSSTISSILVPALLPVVTTLSKMAGAFAKLPAPVQKFVVLGGALAGLGLLIGGTMLKTAGSVLVMRAALIDLAAEGTTIGGTLEAIGAALTGPVGLAIAAGVAAIVGLGLAYKNNWLGIRDATNGAIAWMKPYLTSAWGAIKSDAMSVWGTLKDFFARVWPSIKAIGTTVFGALGDTLRRDLNDLQVMFHGTWGNIEGALRGAWDLIVGVVKTAWAIVAGVITVGLDLLSGRWRAAWNDLKHYAGMAWDGIKQIVSGGLRAVGNLVLGFGRVLYNAGRAMIEGLVNGIRSGVSAVATAVRNVAEAGVTAAKNALGIHSPSKVYEKIGSESADGYILGWHKKRSAIAAEHAAALKVKRAMAASQHNYDVANTFEEKVGKTIDVEKLKISEAVAKEWVKDFSHSIVLAEKAQREAAKYGEGLIAGMRETAKQAAEDEQRALEKQQAINDLNEQLAEDLLPTQAREQRQILDDMISNLGRGADPQLALGAATRQMTEALGLDTSRQTAAKIKPFWSGMARDADRAFQGIGNSLFENLLSGQKKSKDAFKNFFADLKQLAIEGLARMLTEQFALGFKSLFGGNVFGSIFGHGGHGGHGSGGTGAAGDKVKASMKQLTDTLGNGARQVGSSLFGLVGALAGAIAALSGGGGGRHHGGLFGAILGGVLAVATGGASLAVGAAIGGGIGAAIDHGSFLQGAFGGYQLGTGLSGIGGGTPPIVGTSKGSGLAFGMPTAPGSGGYLRANPSLGGSGGGSIVMNIYHTHNGNISSQIDQNRSYEQLGEQLRRDLRSNGLK